MSLYSSIDRRINADAWFRGLSRDAGYLFLRLLTGPHVTAVPGLWAATEQGLARAFGFTLEGFREAFAELSRDLADNGLPRVLADWDAGVIWLPNALKQKCNQPSNPNVLKGWATHLHLVPESDLKDRGIAALRDWVLKRPKRFKQGWPECLPNPSAKGFGLVPAQEQEQEQEQEQKLPEGGDGAEAGAESPEPRNLTGALLLPLQRRAQYAAEHDHLASYLVPQRWPEVVAVYGAVVSALSLPDRPLQDWDRDRGLKALVRLLAASDPAYVVRGAKALASDPWWKSKRRGLSDLTAEVLSRALRDAPEAESVTRLKTGLRQPNASNHSDPEEHLATIGAIEV